MKKIAILGCTGSIGKQSLEVIKQHPEEFKVIGLAAGENLIQLIEQIKQFKPKIVAVKSKEVADKLKFEINDDISVYYGIDGYKEVAAHNEVDYVIAAMTGFSGLIPTITAIRAKKNIGLANKETLVAAGHLINEEIKTHKVSLFPIDSEHSAIFQSLQGEKVEAVKKIILTASGGAFRHLKREELIDVTKEQALKHPNWSMGAKITIDSATMMNKGLEVIEAHWLFSLSFDKIEVIIHPESIIHSMVEFKDNSIIAQLGLPDMRIPIQYALSYPDRFKLNTEPLNLAKIKSLNFFEVNMERFPALKLAYQAGRIGGTMPAVLNAANEVAVELFLQGRIKFLEIENVVENVLLQHKHINNPNLEAVIEADEWARKEAFLYTNNKRSD